MRVPKSWEEITIEQYVNVKGVLNMRDIDNIDRNVQLLSVLSGRPVDEVEDLTFGQIADHITKTSFMSTMPEAKAARLFALKGRLFKVCLNPADLTAGQFADLTSFTKEPDSIVENMHKILAVICMPVLRKYNGKTHEKRAQFFYQHMPVSFAYGLAVFFCQLLKDSVDAIENYLVDQATGQLMRVKNLLLTSTSTIGGGTSQSINSAVGTS